MAKKRSPQLVRRGFDGLRLKTEADWKQWRIDLRNAQVNKVRTGLGSVDSLVIRGMNHIRNRRLRIEDHVMLDLLGAVMDQVRERVAP